jgi:hypothetical protein
MMVERPRPGTGPMNNDPAACEWLRGLCLVKPWWGRSPRSLNGELRFEAMITPPTV